MLWEERFIKPYKITEAISADEFRMILSPRLIVMQTKSQQRLFHKDKISEY